MKTKDFAVESLGKYTEASPLKNGHFVEDGERLLLESSLEFFKKNCGRAGEPPSFELAGPRRKIFFDPASAKSAVVTCGGLCPGINDVIRGLVMEMHYRYGARNVIGFRYGYQGLIPAYGHEPLELTPEFVRNIHQHGGSVLASSRGPQDIAEMVNTLVRMNIGILFTIGGDGTLRGSYEIHREIKRRKLNISVIGIPKTIDNDLCYIEQTFGFETAFTEAVQALRSAHNEAEGYYNGVGLVKLMGRHSGFITASAALANSEANFVLVPEAPFALDGPGGLFEALEERLKRRRHALILAAEGAGQDLIAKEQASAGKDASGNVKLLDVGAWLRDRIMDYFKKKNMDITLKYIDPSYMIRSIPAIPSDSIYCAQLARNAAHAGMAGKTGIVVGRWNGAFTHAPIPIVTGGRNTIDPNGPLWSDVLESTGQPAWGVGKSM
jgi:6-phosphofructokinase 1